MKYVYFLAAASLVASSAMAGEPPDGAKRGGPHAEGSGHGRQKNGPHGPNAAASGDRLHRMERADRDAGPANSAGHAGRDHASRAHWRELHQKFRDKKAKPEELKKEIGEWREAREKRRDEHRRVLISRWGPALAKPNVAQELELHARRQSRLQRMEEVIATERQGEERVKLLAKVDKLREQEKERHEGAMARLTSGQPGASASAKAAASGAPSAAPAASGGVR